MGKCNIVFSFVLIFILGFICVIMPVGASAENFGQVPMYWDYNYTGQRGLNSPDDNAQHVTLGTYHGYSNVIKLDCYEESYTLYNSNADREINSNWRMLNAGSVLYFSMWVWTDASTIGDTVNNQHGATLGVDLYGYAGRICEVENKGGYGVALTHNGLWNDYGRDTVMWGSGGWVQLSMTFVMPSQVPKDHNPNTGVWEPYGMYEVGAFIPWICGNSESPSDEGASIYIRDIELYIDNEAIPTPTPSPTPTASPTPNPSASPTRTPVPMTSYAVTNAPTATVYAYGGNSLFGLYMMFFALMTVFAVMVSLFKFFESSENKVFWVLIMVVMLVVLLVLFLFMSSNASVFFG